MLDDSPCVPHGRSTAAVRQTAVVQQLQQRAPTRPLSYIGSRKNTEADVTQKRSSGTPAAACLAVDETVILLHPPLPPVGVSTVTQRERQLNGSPADG